MCKCMSVWMCYLRLSVLCGIREKVRAYMKHFILTLHVADGAASVRDGVWRLVAHGCAGRWALCLQEFQDSGGIRIRCFWLRD